MSLLRKCAVCGASLGIFSGKYAVKDGFVCNTCYFSSGIKLMRSDARVEVIRTLISGKPVPNTKTSYQSRQVFTQPHTASAQDREKIAKAKERMKEYVVFDLETSGLNPRKNEIVEIGAVKVSDGVIVDTFSTLVKPKKGISAEVSEINGITDEMLSDAPSINLVLPKFKRFIGTCTLVGHNVEFDCRFVYIAFARFGIKFTNKYVDTLEMARKAYPQLDDHKLGTLCDYLNIENETAHRALSDTQATQKLFSILSDKTPAVSHKLKPIDNIRLYDTRPSEKTQNIIELVKFIAQLSGKDDLSVYDLPLLDKWLTEYSQQANEYPASRLPAILKLTDCDIIREELRKLTVIPYTEKYDKKIDLNGKTVVLSGEFRNGSFEEVSALLKEKGADVRERAIKQADYLVIGDFGSPDWSFGNYGNDLKSTMEYIDKGAGTIIISEKNFFKALK